MDIRKRYGADVRIVGFAHQCRHQTGLAAQGRFDCLVCKGDAVLLAVEFNARDAWLGPAPAVPGLETVAVSLEELTKPDVSRVTDAIWQQLRLQSPPLWRCKLKKLTASQMARLEDECMLESVSDSGRRIGGVPSPYGTDMGIVLAYLPTSTPGRYRRVPVCSARTGARLRAMLASPPDEAQPTDGPIPLAVRLARHRGGLPSDPRRSAQLVRRMADMRMSDYLRDQPAARRHFDGCYSYLETVCRVSQHVSAFPDRRAMAMAALAAPFLPKQKD